MSDQSPGCRKSAEWLIQTLHSHHALTARCIHPQADGSVQMLNEAGEIVAVVTACGVVIARVDERPEC